MLPRVPVTACPQHGAQDQAGPSLVSKVQLQYANTSQGIIKSQAFWISHFYNCDTNGIY